MPKAACRISIVLVLFAGCSVVFGWFSAAWAQRNPGAVALSNIELLLEGAVSVEAGEVRLSDSPRALTKKMERVLLDVWALSGLDRPESFRGLSDEVETLLEDIESLSLRDTRRLGGRLKNLSEVDRLYWLIQSRLEEVKLQVAVEMGVYMNNRLHEDLLDEAGEVSEADLAAIISNWTQLDSNAPLPVLPLDGGLSVGAPEDRSSLPGRGNDRLDTSPSDDALLDRIVSLLEAHDERLRRLEARSGAAPIDGPSSFPDFQGSAGLRPPSAVPELSAIGLPDAFDIRFGPTSSTLGLNAQMQLSEVIELLGRYPQLRVVCTGHTDAEGDRGANIALSRKRAEAVRTYLLQSGVRDERVLLNFFGEERAVNAGAADRRVEVAFFAN
jgi:outer membrane protein OmpA-like peptidoglycan-associated protein